ncbi:MAG: toxin TcdB middle/N-terminal domain-containing protein, partial [Bacteroidales bacterium]|nr:toxin TcdB middle/N-terminal domain-containing protein [Bacteroidales bacterium]
AFIESSLVLNEAFNTPIDTSNQFNLSDTTAMFNSIDNMINNPNFAYNPLNSTFLMMNPDVVSKSYKCFGDYTEIRKHYTSLSRMIMDLTFEDTPIPHYPNQPPPKAVNKHNVTEVYSRNYGAVSGPLSVGLSKSSNFSQVQCDFMDLNGDRFPDAIGPANVQYSKPQGGLSTVILPHYVPSMFAHMNESESIGAAIGGSYVETKEVVSNNTTQQKKSTSTAATISGSGAICEDNTIYTWVDVNGDGLPDKVNNNGEVALNLGYKFSELEDWNFVNIRNGISINGSLSIGYSMWNGSFSGGLGATESWNKTTSSLQDMNGDGLPDIVYQEGNTLKVCLNLGAEFSTPITWIDNTDDYSKGLTTNQSYNVAVSFGFPIPLLGIPFKIVINPSANWSVSVNRNLVQISDLDGDGYPDYLSSNDSEHLNVRYSTIGRTNMLKQVNNLASGYFAIDYTQSKNSFKSPQRMWVMSELKVFDGHIGDGVDLMRYTFEYDSAVYSRYDRQSLGFKTVKTHQHKTSSSQVVYRTTTEKYHNDAKKYLFKGLKYYDEIASANGEKFIVNTYKFDLKEINSGFVINDANAHCMGAGYPALSEKSTFFYEGQQNYQKSVRERYEHGTNGNVIKYYYDGEMTSPNNAEKFYAEIYYHPDIEGVNLLSIPEQIIVKNNVGAVLQKRQTEINYFNGSVDKIKTFYDDNNFADYLFTYYSNGNLHTFSKPLDVNNDRYTIIYQYDNVVQQYPISVTDVMGYSSSTNYDYKWGSVLSSIDITGNEMQYQYDSRNRLISVRGPYEIENHIPYAIKHQYFTPNNSAAPTVPWAMTKHFNPDYNDDIITITFADGLGRIVQTKKSSIVYNPITDYYDPLMTVSGKVIYDDFGRVVEQYYPITETLGNETVFNPNFDGVNPTVLKYDILDRKTQTILPDNVTENISYDIQNDAYNKKQFQTTIVDFNQKSTVIYTDFKGQKTSITDPLQNVTKFNYSPIGLMTESYDPENIQTKYFYDIAGRLTCRIHPDAGQTSYTYDKTGKVLSMKTQDLDNRNVEINYEYHYNQLIYTSYPDNPEMNVRYTYGDPSSGNQAGRLLYQQDATGLQEFSYGKLGELIKNVRTFVLPEQFVYTFTMEWQYDTWNRIRQVTYPDGEIVGYNYDRAGMIDQVYGVKGNQTFNYVNRHGYDKFGNKNMMQYSNGITTFYEYDNVRRRLTRLVGKDSYGDRIQDITYTYDAANNITKVEKSAERGVGGVPYSTTITYQYDDLYRMTCSGGLMLYNNNGNYMFKMCLAYSPSGNISTKQLDSEILTVNGDENKFYYFNYAYQGTQPHTLSSLRYDNGEKLYEWTPNGNMQKEEDFYSGSLVATRKMHWDEENRLTTLLDVDKTLNYYTYDAAGERTLKLTGNFEEMNINGQYNINAYNLNTYTLY